MSFLLEESTLSYINTALWGLFTLPIIVYCGYQLKVNWTEQYMIKRRRAIIITIYCTFAAMSIFLVPMTVIPNLFNLNESQRTIVSRLFETLDTPARWAINLLFGARVWLLYFDYQHGAVLATKSWQILISPELVEKNWFLHKRNTLGNHDFIMRFIICPAVVCRLMIEITMPIMIHSNPIVVHYFEPIAFGLLSAMTVLFMFYIWYRLYSYINIHCFVVRMLLTRCRSTPLFQ